MNFELILEKLIGDGIITQEEFDRKVEEFKSNPELPQNKITEVKSEVSALDTRTTGMQEIDFFTLDQTGKLDTRTSGMQDIDQFTLDLAFELQAKIDELEQRIITLEGGN